MAYGPVQILFNVDFDVHEGELVALLGTNGAGKSTLLKGICGLVKRDTLPEVDLGFAFMPEYRGLGYAYESALAVRGHATGALGIRKLLAITSPMNTASARLLERLGFALESESIAVPESLSPIATEPAANERRRAHFADGTSLGPGRTRRGAAGGIPLCQV